MGTSSHWLQGGTVISGRGDDPSRVGVLIEDGRITRIGGRAPRNADVIDCSGLTLTPGLIDAHVHLGLSSPVEASVNYGTSVAEIAADIFANCAQTLSAGFTTVRDVGGIDGGLVRAVASGKIPGPRILQCGPLHCQTGGHGHFAPDWEPTSMWCVRDIPGLRSLSVLSDGPHEMRQHVRESFRRGAEFVKLCVTGGVISKHDHLTDTQFTVEEIATAVAEADARGTYVTVHALNATGIRNAVEAGARCVEHGAGVDEELAALMAQRQVALVPTLTAVEAVLTNAIGLPAELSARAAGVHDAMVHGLLAAKAAGVRVGSGSDLVGPDQARRGQELVLRAGVETPMEALVSATRTNAEIIGRGDEIGTLEVGKRADVIAFAGDPLDNANLFADPGRVVLVLQGGAVAKDTRS